MTTSKIPFALNIASLTVGAFLVVYVVHDVVTTEKTPMCHKRFEAQTEFGLMSKSNAALSAAELQARVGAHEFGIMKNASIIQATEAPAPMVLSVKLPKGKGSVFNDPTKAGGISFRWDPRGMVGAERACLSYQVLLPSTFDFGSAGVLPGLYGGGGKYDAKTKSDGINGFASRVAWSSKGSGTLNLQVPGTSQNRLTRDAGVSNFSLPKGQWVAIEQEIALNTPTKEDGILRLWVNGELKINLSNVVWRKNASLTLSGVLNDVSYGSIDSDASAPADTALAISPLLISWKENKIVQ
jgi:hypothetical protein